MSLSDNIEQLNALRQWQNARLAAYGKDTPSFGKGPSDVTVLNYFFRPEEVAATYFPYTQCAIYETWRHCGAMKTVIVSHAITSPVAEFANRFPGLVEVQIEPSLLSRSSGAIHSMSVDCNSRLHTRFSTSEVLIVQDDGFPLRPGIEEFIGKADFIGAPQCRDTPLVRLANLFLRFWPQNGGFSLRSKHVCEMASYYWRNFYEDSPSNRIIAEDMFYTNELVRRFPRYRYGINLADSRLSLRFSREMDFSLKTVEMLPFGFHSARAFSVLHSTFGF